MSGEEQYGEYQQQQPISEQQYGNGQDYHRDARSRSPESRSPARDRSRSRDRGAPVGDMGGGGGVVGGGEPDINRKLFIGGLNWSTTDKTLEEFFSKYGAVEASAIMYDKLTGRSRGFGFITFREEAGADVCMDAFKANSDEFEVDGRKLTPRRAQSKESMREHPPSARGTKRLFVGQLPPEAQEPDLRGLFEQFGAVNDVDIIINKQTNEPRGFAFVQMEEDEAVDRAVQAGQSQPFEVHGKQIEVKRAEARQNRDGPRGGFRGGRGGPGAYGGGAYGGAPSYGYGGGYAQGGGYGGSYAPPAAGYDGYGGRGGGGPPPAGGFGGYRGKQHDRV